jgi:FkbM family methyltransferase
MLDRAAWYVRARRRARRFGFPFVRRKWFRLPRRLRVNGAAVALDWLPEHGVRAAFTEVFLGDNYGLEIIADQDGAAIRRVLDVGANVGWFALAARSHFPGAAIHAYEPNAAAVAFLRRNTEALGVVAHREAVGASAGRVSLIIPDGKSVRAHTVDGGDIPQVAFADALARLGGADLVKLDCEGAEWPLLDDPAPWAGVRWLTVEYHLWARPGATHAAAASAITRLGFKVVRQQTLSTSGLLLARRG